MSTHHITTERLFLRPFTLGDLNDYAAILGDPEVGKYLPKGTGYTKKEVRKWLYMIIKHYVEDGFGPWALVLKEDGSFIGSCGLRVLPETGEVEVLYEVARKHWGKGLASEGAKASVDFGFRELGLERIIGLTKPENTPSRKVLENAGLSFVRMAPYFGFECAVYELLVRDWRDGLCP